MSETAKGFWAVLAACVVWGLSPLYYKFLAGVPPLEVLSHRTLWSLGFFGAVLALQGRLGAVRPALAGRGAAAIGAAAVLISINWFVFIWSVQVGRALDASFGYFLLPLAVVSIGVLGLGEKLLRAQQVAVGMAALAVAVLSWGLGAAPWIALTIATSFGFYGLLKKRLAVAPMVSVTAEVLLLSPLAIAWLVQLHWRGLGVFGTDPATSALLAFSGVLTGGPLMLFSYAARRVRLTTLGLMQYLNPILQFLCAVLVFGEPFTLWHRIAFALIWGALVLYTVAGLRQPKALASNASSASTSGTGVR